MKCCGSERSTPYCPMCGSFLQIVLASLNFADAEKAIIIGALKIAQNHPEAAKITGIKLRTFSRRVKKYGIKSHRSAPIKTER